MKTGIVKMLTAVLILFLQDENEISCVIPIDSELKNSEDFKLEEWKVEIFDCIFEQCKKDIIP